MHDTTTFWVGLELFTFDGAYCVHWLYKKDRLRPVILFRNILLRVAFSDKEVKICQDGVDIPAVVFGLVVG